MAGGPAIRAQHLRKTYGDGHEALRGVSFDVAYGEVFAYLGRNGSGKTTTVRILTGLSAATAGAAWVAGGRVGDVGVPRSEIGVTMQSAALDHRMTGREHLAFLAGFWGLRGSLRTERVAEFLGRFGLTDAADKRISSYSGGMKRRLDLAGALLHHPAILFLDEPTTGLDAQSRRALWKEVRSLRDSGAAVFLTTQYLEEAEELADRVAILERGLLVASGYTDELRRRVGSIELTVTLDREARVPSLELPDGRRVSPDLRGSIRVPYEDVDGALAALHYVRARVASIEAATVEAPTLEDVFLQLTGEGITESPAALDPVA